MVVRAITKRQYLTEIVMTSAHKISESTPIAVSRVNRPPVVWMIVCKVYSGLDPRSP
jgi:hypothetical protein